MLEDNKILQSEIDSVKVGSVQGNRLVGTVQENKNVFDRLALIIADKFNALVDRLENYSTKNYVDTAIEGVVAGQVILRGHVKSYLYENVILSVSSWVNNTCTSFDEQERIDYPYMAIIPLDGVLATDCGDALPSYPIQVSRILGNYATANNGFVVESREIPTEDISFEWIRIDRRLT